jgi:predicted  nucleic acid-binding Zn-ribbon protein
MKTKTKTVPVKDLRKAIEDGMTYDEAASHALKALKPKLNCLREEVDVDMEDLLENIIGCMVERKDQVIRFKVEEDRGDEILSWDVVAVRRYLAECPIVHDLERITYFPFNMDHAEACANEDAATLNQFVLDFYGIKKYVEPKPTKKNIQAELRRVKAEISEKKSELKNLTSQMNKLSKALKGNT